MYVCMYATLGSVDDRSDHIFTYFDDAGLDLVSVVALLFKTLMEDLRLQYAFWYVLYGVLR